MPPTQNNTTAVDSIISQFDALHKSIIEITDREQTKVINVKLKDKLKTDANEFRYDAYGSSSDTRLCLLTA
jgi:hypothetical protein